MSNYNQDNKRVFAVALGVIILIMGSFAAITVTPRPSADTTSNTTTNITSQEVAITCATHSYLNVDNSLGGNCQQPSVSDLLGNIVNTFNTLVGDITLTHFTSLNMTTVGNTITLGINLAHSNTWSALQTFAADINLNGGDNCIKNTAISSTCMLTFDTASGVYLYNLASHGIALNNITNGAYFFQTGGGIFVLDSGHYNPSNGNTCKFTIRTNSIDRLAVDTNACAAQGSSQITTFESIIPNTANTNVLGSVTNYFSAIFVGDSYSGIQRCCANSISIYTSNAAVNGFVERLRFGGGSAQGSGGITAYEPILITASTLSFQNSVTNIIQYISAGGTTLNQIKLDVGANNDIQILTANGSNVPTLRLDFGGNAAQGSAGITTYENILAGSDNAINIGDATNRFKNVITKDILQYAGSGDANPTIKLQSSVPALEFGSGGASALDLEFFRQGVAYGTGFTMQPLSTNSPSIFTIEPSGTNTNAIFALCRTNSCVTNYEILELSADNSCGGSCFGLRVINGGSGSLLPFYIDMSGTHMFKMNTDYTLSFYGSSSSTLVFGTSTTGIKNTQGFQSIIAIALNAGSNPVTVTLPVAEPDTTYAVVCTGDNQFVQVNTKTTTTFKITYNNAVTGTADCIVTHQ